MQAIYPIFAQAEFWRNAKKDRQTRGSTMLSIGVVQPALSLLKNVHIGFSQQQPKQQQRVPALQRAGRLSVCG